MGIIAAKVFESHIFWLGKHPDFKNGASRGFIYKICIFYFADFFNYLTDFLLLYILWYLFGQIFN